MGGALWLVAQCNVYTKQSWFTSSILRLGGIRGVADAELLNKKRGKKTNLVFNIGKEVFLGDLC
jgi:hypothetical protein